eukprot:scaffold36336_cov168-Amphora_coffeaeformis.AAC.2
MKEPFGNPDFKGLSILSSTAWSLSKKIWAKDEERREDIAHAQATWESLWTWNSFETVVRDDRTGCPYWWQICR